MVYNFLQLTRTQLVPLKSFAWQKVATTVPVGLASSAHCGCVVPCRAAALQGSRYQRTSSAMSTAVFQPG